MGFGFRLNERESKIVALDNHIRESDLHVAPVKDGVVLSDENVSNNPANTRRKVDSHESPDALSLRFNDVVFLLQVEVLSCESKSNIGGISVTIDSVFSLHQSLGSNLCGECLDIIGRSSNQTGSGINDGALFRSDRVSIDAQSSKRNVPVGFLIASPGRLSARPPC